MNIAKDRYEEQKAIMHAQPREDELPGNGRREKGEDHHLTRTLIWVGVAGLSAALAYTVIRSLLSRQPIDPTSQRIQQLIDEANQLLKTLDDQRPGG